MSKYGYNDLKNLSREYESKVKHENANNFNMKNNYEAYSYLTPEKQKEMYDKEDEEEARKQKDYDDKHSKSRRINDNFSRHNPYSSQSDMFSNKNYSESDKKKLIELIKNLFRLDEEDRVETTSNAGRNIIGKYFSNKSGLNLTALYSPHDILTLCDDNDKNMVIIEIIDVSEYFNFYKVNIYEAEKKINKNTLLIENAYLYMDEFNGIENNLITSKKYKGGGGNRKGKSRKGKTRKGKSKTRKS